MYGPFAKRRKSAAIRGHVERDVADMAADMAAGDGAVGRLLKRLDNYASLPLFA